MISRRGLALPAVLALVTALIFAGVNVLRTSAQSGNAEPQVATGQAKAVVPLERPGGTTRSLAATDSASAQNVLTLDLTLVKADPNAPVALEISAPCAAPCSGAQPQGDVMLGQISLFPALRAGESRKVELQLDLPEATALSDQVSVELKALVEGKGVGENAVKVNAAALIQKSGP